MNEKLAELQGEIETFIIINSNFNTPPSVPDRASRQKIRKDVQGLHNTINQFGLIDIKPYTMNLPCTQQ